MALNYEVHGRNGWYPIDLYDNPEKEGTEEKPKILQLGVLFFKTRKIADEVAAKLNEALVKGHVEATERIGL